MIQPVVQPVIMEKIIEVPVKVEEEPRRVPVTAVPVVHAVPVPVARGPQVCTSQVCRNVDVSVSIALLRFAPRCLRCRQAVSVFPRTSKPRHPGQPLQILAISL